MSTNVGAIPVVKRFAPSFIGGPGSGRTRKECWGATTVDGMWDIERVDGEPGTPWMIRVAATGDFGGVHGTLKAARAAIASGDADRRATESQMRDLFAWMGCPHRSFTMFETARALFRGFEFMAGSGHVSRDEVARVVRHADIAQYRASRMAS